MRLLALVVVYLVVPLATYVVVSQSTGSALLAWVAAVVGVFLAIAILERVGRALSRWYRGPRIAGKASKQ
jgi:hypothetical protein